MLKRIFSFCAIIIFLSVGHTASRKAPTFALLNNKGEYINKKDLSGNLLISFWASYCKPCMKEIPEIIEIQKKYSSANNLTLVLINVDDNKGTSSSQKAEETLKKINVNHGYLLDPFQITLKKYNPSMSVPAVYLVDKNGNIVHEQIGNYSSFAALEKKIAGMR